MSGSSQAGELPTSSSRKSFTYCNECGLKNPATRPFCKDCATNLKPDYDFPFIHYETSDRFSRLNDVTQSIPVTKIVELFLDRLGTPWVEAQQLGTAVRIGEKQFPDLYDVAVKCAEALAVPRMPRIYINNTPGFFLGEPWPILTVGTNEDPIIIVNNSMANKTTQEEFRFIIGREMGHIKCGHPLYSTTFQIARELASATLGYGLGVEGLKGSSFLGKIAGSFIGAVIVDQPLAVLLNAWYREANYTADRAGLIAVGKIDVPKSLFARLLMGWYFTGGLSTELNFDELLKQEEEMQDSSGRFAEYLGPLGDFLGPITVPQNFNPGYAMPYVVKRLRSLLEFQETPYYKNGRRIIEDFSKGIYQVSQDTSSEPRFCGFCGGPVDQGKCKQCGRIPIAA